MSSMLVSVKKTALGKTVGFYSHFILNNSLKREGTCTVPAILQPGLFVFSLLNRASYNDERNCHL